MAMVILLIICGSITYVIYLPIWLINRIVRGANIRKNGWPPSHCDGDGDFKEDKGDKDD